LNHLTPHEKTANKEVKIQIKRETESEKMSLGNYVRASLKKDSKWINKLAGQKCEGNDFMNSINSPSIE